MPELKINVSRRLVQHCNAKTDYFITIHAFNPTECESCEELRRLIEIHVEGHWKEVTNDPT